MDKITLGEILITMLEEDDDPRAFKIIEILKKQMENIPENIKETTKKREGPFNQVIGLDTLTLTGKNTL